MSITTAEQLEENEQYDKAYEEYKKVLDQKPKSLEVLERLGHLAVMLDKKEDAVEYFNRILELDATSVLAYEQLMDIYFHTDRYKYYVSRGNLHIVQQEVSHAISDFKKALDKAETAQETNAVRFVLANLYEQTGKTHPAIDEYLRIIDTTEVEQLVYLKLANLYVKEDSLSSAIDILERARTKGFDTPEIKETLAQLYLKTSDTEKARELTSDDLTKAKSLLDEEKNDSAFEILNKITGANKNKAQYHSLFAQYYFNKKDWENALQSVSSFEKMQQDSPLIYQMRALIYEEQNKEFDAHINWAKYNLARHEKDVALNEYFLAYQINPKDPVLIRNLAELLEDLGDKNQSNEFWEKLTEIDSTNRKALEKVAEFRHNIGDHRAEAEILEKLFSIDKRNALVCKKLATTYEKLRNKEKALQYYNKFITISPVNDEYEQIKLKISKLENVEMEEDEGLIGKIMKLFSKK